MSRPAPDVMCRRRRSPERSSSRSRARRCSVEDELAVVPDDEVVALAGGDHVVVDAADDQVVLAAAGDVVDGRRCSARSTRTRLDGDRQALRTAPRRWRGEDAPLSPMMMLRAVPAVIVSLPWPPTTIALPAPTVIVSRRPSAGVGGDDASMSVESSSGRGNAEPLRRRGAAGFELVADPGDVAVVAEDEVRVAAAARVPRSCRLDDVARGAAEHDRVAVAGRDVSRCRRAPGSVV